MRLTYIDEYNDGLMEAMLMLKTISTEVNGKYVVSGDLKSKLGKRKILSVETIEDFVTEYEVSRPEVKVKLNFEICENRDKTLSINPRLKLGIEEDRTELTFPIKTLNSGNIEEISSSDAAKLRQTYMDSDISILREYLSGDIKEDEFDKIKIAREMYLYATMKIAEKADDFLNMATEFPGKPVKMHEVDKLSKRINSQIDFMDPVRAIIIRRNEKKINDIHEINKEIATLNDGIEYETYNSDWNRKVNGNAYEISIDDDVAFTYHKDKDLIVYRDENGLLVTQKPEIRGAFVRVTNLIQIIDEVWTEMIKDSDGNEEEEVKTLSW